MPDEIDDKATARSRFVNNRRALGNRERARQSALAVRRLLAEPLLTSAKTVAAYWPLGTEPDPRGLFGEVLARGAKVLLPVVLPDRDLDWARYAGDADALAEADAGTLAPAGRRLGVEAVLGAQVLVVPALAVTPMGVRLGRGGGSYDRVLARLANAAAGGLDVPWTCALLSAGELGPLRPGAVEPHDRAVNAACTASRLREFHSL
jgi:5-formyltetrahydrofolate cyclo-ligase